MIVPGSRLIWLAALMLAPFAALGATRAEYVIVSGLIIAGAVILALVDGWLGLGCLNGVGVELPGVVRLLKDRRGVIDIGLKNRSGRPLRVRLGLPLPRDIYSSEDSRDVTLPSAAEWSRLFWPCTATRRGRYRLECYCLEGSSPLGLWAVRSRMAADSEIRVYPNLASERKIMAPLFLRHGLSGSHAQRQVGRGRDFEKLRHYSPGDSYDEIHWKATAKRQFPITKVFQTERTQEVYVILDASRLSGRSLPWPRNGGGREEASRVGRAKVARTGEETTLERFVTASLVLGMAAEEQGDLFGLMTFSDRVHGFLRARNGKAHYAACRDMLFTLQPRVISPDFDDLCSFIGLRLRRRALLVFLTTLDDPVLAEEFARNMGVLCRRHLVLVGMLQPPDARALFSDPGARSLDDLYRHLGGHMQANHLNELAKVLHRLGARFCLVDNERMSTELVSQYVGIKRRQLL